MKDPADSNLDQHQPILSFLEFDENTPYPVIYLMPEQMLHARISSEKL